MLLLIDGLDTMDGDTDREPSLVGFDGVSVPTDDREGGDVLDEVEPNDWDGEDGGDDESSMGWATPRGECQCSARGPAVSRLRRRV